MSRHSPLAAPPSHLRSPRPPAAAAVEAADEVAECTRSRRATLNPLSATHGEGAHDGTPIAGLQLLLYFPAFAGILPSLRAATPPPLESSDDCVVQQPSMLHWRRVAIDAHRTLLVPRFRCWSSSQPAHTEQGPDPFSSPLKLHRGLIWSSSRVVVSPVQSAPLQGSPQQNAFHSLDYRSHRVGNKVVCLTEQTHQLGRHFSNTRYYADIPKRHVTAIIQKTKRTHECNLSALTCTA